MVNYFYDCYSILNKVYGEKAFLKQAILSTFIEEKNRSLTVKTCYGVLDKDIELSYYIESLCDKNPKLAIRTILKIAMYAIKYLDKHDYAVIKNAVELTKKLGKSGVSGFVNAFLRKFVATNIKLPVSDDVKYLSVKYSYPEFAVKELIKTYGKERTESIISVFNDKSTLAFYDVNGEEYLLNKGIEHQKTTFDNVFIVKNFTRNADYDNGTYTFQSIGSVAICDMIEPCDNILDCCAAPGGKSVRLSYKCKNLTAFELHPHRAELIKDYAKRMKRENIAVFAKDAKEYDEAYNEKLDAVLADVPCSGFGVVGENPDIKLNRKEEDIDNLNKEQLGILKTVSRYVKKGGYLYYSTCSIFARENIDVINAFMSDIKKGFEIEKTVSKLQAEDVFNTVQFLPDVSLGAGFYFAKLKRIF